LRKQAAPEDILERKVFNEILAWILSDPAFLFDNGYACPYCGLGRQDRIPRTAIAIAIHIIREHRDEAVDLLVELDM